MRQYVEGDLVRINLLGDRLPADNLIDLAFELFDGLGKHAHVRGVVRAREAVDTELGERR